MTTVPQSDVPLYANLRGKVGMWCLIVAESSIFSIFVVAYLYYAGKSISGPTPAQVLDVPYFASICLFSSSLTIWLAERALHRGNVKQFGLFWFITLALGVIFLFETGMEWYRPDLPRGIDDQHQPFRDDVLLAGRAARIPRHCGRDWIDDYPAVHLVWRGEAGTCGTHQRVRNVLAFCRRDLGGCAVGGVFHYAMNAGFSITECCELQ